MISWYLIRVAAALFISISMSVICAWGIEYEYRHRGE